MNDKESIRPTGARSLALALAGAFFLCPVFGWAQPALLQDAKSVGLIGTWAASCPDGASEKNIFVTFYGTRKNMLRRRIDRGSETMKLEGAVDSLQILDGNRLRMRVRNDDDNWGPSNGQVYDTLISLGGDRLRTLSSINRAGEELVQNGRFAANGEPFPTLRRCSR